MMANTRDLNQYETSYQNHEFESFQANQRRQHIIDFINKNKKSRILEIGCGMLPLFESMEDFDLFDVIEPGEIFYNHALSLLSKSVDKYKINIHQKYLENFKTDTSYDLIICAGLLHEVQDDGKILDCLFQLASKDTLVYVNTLNVNSFHRLLALEAGLIKDVYQLSESQKKLQQYHTYSMSGLAALAEKHGFTVENKESIIFKPFTHRQMQELIEKKIISPLVLKSLTQMVKYTPDFGSELSFTLKKN